MHQSTLNIHKLLEKNLSFYSGHGKRESRPWFTKVLTKKKYSICSIIILTRHYQEIPILLSSKVAHPIWQLLMKSRSYQFFWTMFTVLLNLEIRSSYLLAAVPASCAVVRRICLLEERGVLIFSLSHRLRLKTLI